MAMPEAVKHQIEFEVVFTQENPTIGKRLIDRRAVRMAQCADATITGMVQFNDNQIELPTPFTWAAMKRNTGADTVATKINLQRLNGAAEAVSELLDFTVKMIPPEGLESVYFENWEAITGLELDILAMMANKASTLKELSICYM